MNQEKVSSANLSKNDVEIRSSRLPLQETRSLILGLSALVGELCSLFLQVVPLDSSSKESNNKVATPEIAQCMAQLVKVLLKTSASLDIHLETAIWKKMELNNKKYPVELCKVNISSSSLAYLMERKYLLNTQSRLVTHRRERLENTQIIPVPRVLRKKKDNRRCI